MAQASEQDPCLEWLLSSPVALYISEMDHRQRSTKQHHEGLPTNMMAAPPTQLRWEPEHQNHRRPSIASDSSAPGMVVDAGASSPGTSWEVDEYSHHTLDDVVWDSWLEDNSYADTQFYSHETKSLPLRTQRSNLTLPNPSLAAPGLTKMRSVGDFRRPKGTTPPPSRYRTYVLPTSSPLYTTTYEEWDSRLLGDTTPTRSYDPVLPQTIFRSPPSPQKGTLLEPRPQRPIPSINTSLYTVPHPSEWLSQTVQPLPPLLIGEKSVFEDWDEPKSNFWRRNHKRKRRSTSESGSDGNGNNKSPRKRGRKLWNLNLLAMPA